MYIYTQLSSLVINNSSTITLQGIASSLKINTSVYNDISDIVCAYVEIANIYLPYHAGVMLS